MSGTSAVAPLAVRWGTGLALAVVAWYFLMAWAYALAPSFLDHFEPSIALGALRVLAGEQAFHDSQSAAQYASIYGPNAYLVNAAWIALWPDVIAGSKLAGAAAAMVFCAVFAVACIRKHGRTVACLQLAFTLGGGLLFGHASYWNRPEPLQLIGVALALLSLTLTSPRWMAVALGTAVALLVNLKVHSLLYVLPIIGLLVSHRQWRELRLGALVAAVGIAAPFLASDLFSIRNYIQLLAGATQHPLSFALLERNIAFLVFLALPLVACVVYGRKAVGDDAGGVYLVTLGGVGVLVCLIGSKAGAGPHHLLPLLPLVAWGMGQPLRAFVRSGTLRLVPTVLAAAWVVVLLGFAGRVQMRVWTSIQQDEGRLVIADLAAIRATYPAASIQMGTAGPDQWSLYWYRPALRSHNPVDFVDATTRMDAHLLGRDLPASTRDVLERGQFDIWLIPKGGAPFTQTSYYPPFGEIFSRDVRQAFEHGYRRARGSAYFDIYLARRIGGA